jgi:hypothetical protein
MNKSNEPIFLTIIQRVLFFAPVFVIALIASLILFGKWIINYIRYGGEAITYTEKMNRKTIQDVFEKLNEIKQP